MTHWLREWRRGPVVTLIVAWVLCAGALLTTYVVAQARIVEREFREMGFRLGGTAAHIQVNWLDMWPQLALLFLAIVVLPPATFWLLWHRARFVRASSRLTRHPRQPCLTMDVDQNRRPDAADVARRALILKLQFIHSVMSPPLEVVSKLRTTWSAKDLEQFVEKMDEGRARLIDKMRADGLWEDTSAAEREFFETSLARVSHQQRVNASWRLESIHCLAWALGLTPEIPAYDTKTDPEKLLGLIPVEPAEFIRSAGLRPESEISGARDVAELWHWRSRTRQLQEQGYRPKTGHTSLDAIVREVAPRAAADGTIPAPIDGDFPALGRAYRDLSAQEWGLLQSIAMERHFALNWLCGYAPGGDWDATPTET